MKKLLIFLALCSLCLLPLFSAKAEHEQPCLTEREAPICDDGNTYNGYWWWNEWVPGLPTFSTQFLRLPTLSIGSAVFYAPGAMEANVEYRGLSMAGMVGAVALPFCSEIGHTVWLQRPGKGAEGPFMVADCSRRNDMYGQIEFRDQVVEVDFETAVRWGMTKRTGFDGYTAPTERMDGVLVSKDPEQLGVNPVDLSVWFLGVVQYAKSNENRIQVQNYVGPYANDVAAGIDNSANPLPLWLINKQWTTFK